MINRQRLEQAYTKARDTLLAERTADGYWVGELSASALSTATAITALQLTGEPRPLVDAGLDWLSRHQNADGGWGDTTKSLSNISTTMLCRAALHVCDTQHHHHDCLERAEAWLRDRHGRTDAELAEAVRARYGRDRTFAVPILTMAALAGLVPWREVPRLPYELACLPQSWYRFAKMPVVSYALPALIAIGQCIHTKRGSWNPIAALIRRLGRGRSLRVLATIQPSSGGYLEATPLTSFVVMSLAALPHATPGSAARKVIDLGLHFLRESARPDGSWAIDSNLSIWVTTLSINALHAAGDLASLDRQPQLIAWLKQQQMRTRHPYTGADPGGWGWSHLPGSVPDCDDTPGAMLALQALGVDDPAVMNAGIKWMRGLQNRDGGWPTFCRGWGTLPFDRSGNDLTAHVLRVLPDDRGFAYLARQQRADGSWLPLWFGNQHADDDINPVYGTARVLAAYRDHGMLDSEPARRAIAFLRDIQNADGGWGGAKGTPSTVEETSLVVEVLAGREDVPGWTAGVNYLIDRVEAGTFADASPIGFYFAKLWYFEKLYPIIFTVAALGRAWQQMI